MIQLWNGLSRSGGIISPGSAHKMSGGGASLYGLAGVVVFSQGLDLIILEVVSSLNDFMVPCLCYFIITCDSD